MERFRDRSDAGRRLARVLMELKNSDPLILALPRGGVPVAYEVAVALCAPLDILIVRKLGVPFQPELAWAPSVRTRCWWSTRGLSLTRASPPPSSGRSSTPSARNWSCGFAVSVVGAHRCRWSGER